MTNLPELPLCSHDDFECVITQVTTIDIETGEDIHVLVSDYFSDPDFVDVELHCKVCGRTRPLENSEWEVA